MITLTVNGRETKLQESINLKDYLESIGVNMKFIAISHNGVIIKKQHYSDITLKDTDQVEIVRPVGGG
jgi:thiamine biosynthesis protein ThiS